jgi:hypothetical protein
MAGKDEGGASLGANPPEMVSKIAGFEYSLDFLVLFRQGKRTVTHNANVFQ